MIRTIPFISSLESNFITFMPLYLQGQKHKQTMWQQVMKERQLLRDKLSGLEKVHADQPKF